MKQYYLVLTAGHSAVWHGDTKRSNTLTKLGGMILPLGTRKPRNVSRETIKEF